MVTVQDALRKRSRKTDETVALIERMMHPPAPPPCDCDDVYKQVASRVARQLSKVAPSLCDRDNVYEQVVRRVARQLSKKPRRH